MAMTFERAEKINQLWVDVINGYSKYELMRRLETDYYNWGSDKWSMSQRYKYLREAYDKCEVEFAEERKKQRELMYDRYLSIYQDAVDARDRKSAVNVLDSLSKLMGLNEPDKVDIKQDVNVSVDFNINNDGEKE
jgi:hypothetical protein